MRLILTIISIAFAFAGNAQSTFENYYSDNNYREFSRYLFEKADSGFVVQASIDGPWTNMVLIRTDKNGNQVWEKTYGTDSIQYKAYAMAPTNDGGYVICGDYQSVLTGPSMDSYLMKVDSNGNQAWYNLYGWTTAQGGGKDHATMVKLMANNKIIVEGFTKDIYFSPGSYSPGSFWNSYLSIFDTSGNMLEIANICTKVDSSIWDLRYHPLDMEVVNNTAFWLGSAINANLAGYRFLAAFDEDLDTLFTQRTGLGNYSKLASTQDGHLLLFGNSVITKMDTLGSIVWSTPFTVANCFLYEMQEQADGTFIAIGGNAEVGPFDGTISYATFNNQVHLVKLSATGAVLWNIVYTPATFSNDYRGYNIVQTKDGGFAFAGYHSNSAWLVKTDSQGQLNSIGEQEAGAGSFSLAPNPAAEIINLAIHDHTLTGNKGLNGEIKIYNALGALVQVSAIDGYNVEMNIAHLVKGMYFIQLATEKGTSTKRFIKN